MAQIDFMAEDNELANKGVDGRTDKTDPLKLLLAYMQIWKNAFSSFLQSGSKIDKRNKREMEVV